MDLSGHGAFRSSGHGQDSVDQPGARLLSTAWVALSTGRAESVSLHLRTGPMIEGVLALRIDGAVAEAATRPGEWSHAFAVEDVVLVRQVVRGGSR